MYWEAFLKENINSEKLNKALIKIQQEYLKEGKILNYFISPNTVGFSSINKKIVPNIEKILKPFIKKVANIKNHKHEWIASSGDGDWLFLVCADEKCDAGKGCVYGKQVKENEKNLHKYLECAKEKYPEFYNSDGQVHVRFT